MTFPKLKQFAELSQLDFDASPIWVHCHVVDYDEPWYADTDEETFRPWQQKPPVDPANGTTYLVSAEFRLAARTPPLRGFVTPVPEGAFDLGLMQPNLFRSSGRLGAFWLGMFGQPDLEFYRELSAQSDPVFPIRFSALPGLSLGLASGVLEGFYRWSEAGAVVVSLPS
jgi:hypothetical protein